MTAAGQTAVTLDAARLVGPLRRLVTRTAGAAAAEDLTPAVDALRAFVQRPSPAGFLAAARCLRAAARQQKLLRLTSVAAPRRSAEHLAVIAQAAGLSPEQQRLLARLPSDAGTYRRFAVIAQLLTAHHLLSASAEATHQDLQDHLGQPTPRTVSSERRRRR